MNAKPALLLVDTQEDFLARPGLTPDRATLVAGIAALFDHARSQGWLVVHVHSRVSEDGSDAMPHRRASPEVVAGLPGAMPPPELAPKDGEALLFKRFFSAFDAEELEELLRRHGVGQLVVAGVHAHACIRDTANDAYRRGFEVILPGGAIGSYDPAHAAQSLGWQDGRAARVVPLGAMIGRLPELEWAQGDPCDRRRILQRVRLTPVEAVHAKANELAGRAPLPLGERRERLVDWKTKIEASRELIRAALVRDVAKPLGDADGEVDYGLALLADAISRMSDEETGDERTVRYRPRGLVGIITPWNNPFAIAVGKLAPALAFGNAVLWKPALAGSRIAELIATMAAETGLGDFIGLATGDAGTGEAILADPNVAALAFTGSSAVGKALIARGAVRPQPIPVQAELGGSNAAVIDASADLNAAAADLASAMFSFSGQRCTAIRRIILVDSIADAFVERLIAQVDALVIGRPDQPGTDIGPLIDRQARERILGGIASGLGDAGRLLCGGGIPPGVPEDGCWLEPTLIEGLGSDHPLNQQEWFGPLGTIQRAGDLDQAIGLHNAAQFGLLGAIYSNDDRAIAAFSERAEAGLLSVNRARPPFSAAGPFAGWKDSGFGIPEHGRWNRDFYTRAQALYRA